MNTSFLKKRLNYLVIAFIGFGFLSCESSYQDEDKQEITQQVASEFYPNKNVTDGPYIYKGDSTINVKWIEQNKLFEVTIFDNDYSLIEQNFGFALDTANLFQEKKVSIDYKNTFNNVENFIAISDMHGQYFVTIDLLKKYGIIDKDLNWSFGKGYLIVDGDIFDRGDKATEILWLIYKLKNQAEVCGGKVHYLIGNHELMVLNNDLRYVNEKYKLTEKMIATSYDQLFSERTVIGEWLRTSPVILTINDVLFVHAGISPEFIENKFTQQGVNFMFQNRIIGAEDEVIENDPILSFLEGRNGPVWYRGYFLDTTFTEQKLDRILDYFDKERIVVGHTSFDSIVSLYDGKILGIDASIKRGKNGELLIFEKGKFYRGTLNFGKIELK
ncbi:MAG: metallophosphoesterase [Bacteroidales bacterium]|nr:metallophosphoesterase [Bacteroidales bacterium]